MLPPDMVGGFGQSRSLHLYPKADYRFHPFLDTVLAAVWLDRCCQLGVKSKGSLTRYEFRLTP